MPDKTKLADIAKNCVIVLLFASAVFLLSKVVFNGRDRLSGELSGFFSGKSGENSAALPGTNGPSSAASPVFLMTTSEDGSHYAVKYAGEDREKLVSQFSAYLGEALGSPARPEAITEDLWREALTGSGVFFDYLYPQPLSVLAAWLGTEASGPVSEKSARRFLLADDGGDVTLYFISAGENRVYSCKTAISFASLAARIKGLPAGSANFAFELGGEYEKLAPYFIFSNESGSLRGLSSVNPAREGFDSSALMDSFGMNSQIANKYAETGGAVVYVDGDKSLRFETAGRLVFSVSGGSGLPLTASGSALGLADCVSACLKIINDSIGLAEGDAEISLAGVSELSDTGNYTVNFAYFAGGIPVVLSGGAYAARFEVRGGTLIRAELHFRSFAFTGDTVLVLPEKQAAVIAAAGPGGEPVLSYEDRPDGVVCTWISHKE